MAIENFTTWTESDTGGFLTVAASSVTWDDLPRQQANTYVYTNCNEAGDFTHQFIYTSGADAQVELNSWIYPYVIRSNVVQPDTASGDAFAIYAVRNATGLLLVARLREAGADAAFDISTALSYSTEYYITVTRDDDGGANNTGQIVVDISTGNYGGLGGSNVDTLTVDCAVGEQNDYSYAMVAAARGSGGTYTQDGIVSNLDFNPSEDSTIELVGSSSITFGSSANLSGNKSLSGTTGITFSPTAIIISGKLSGTKAEKYTRRLVALNNDTLFYEDV
jgi:hypothetical protein